MPHVVHEAARLPAEEAEGAEGAPIQLTGGHTAQLTIVSSLRAGAEAVAVALIQCEGREGARESEERELAREREKEREGETQSE
eukprot:COSAG03_NODE_583_length_6860_cov_9.293300_10_plen_84_part_00